MEILRNYEILIFTIKTRHIWFNGERKFEAGVYASEAKSKQLLTRINPPGLNWQVFIKKKVSTHTHEREKIKKRENVTYKEGIIDYRL
jgi:hypothetical protein